MVSCRHIGYGFFAPVLLPAVALFCTAGAIAFAGEPLQGNAIVVQTTKDPAPAAAQKVQEEAELDLVVPAPAQPAAAAAQPAMPPPAEAPTPAPAPIPADLVVPAQAEMFLSPPKSTEITAFANDVKLPPDFKGVAVTVDREKVMEFFTSGEAHPVDKERGKWRLLADYTLPGAMAADPALVAARKEAVGMLNGRVYANAFVHASGVVASGAGVVYFWRFWNDRVLEVRDEAGRACVLVLGADAKPLAQFAHPYDVTGGEKDPDKKLHGKMPVPAAKDIVAFVNRPVDFEDGVRRNYLDRERLDAYLQTPIPPMRAPAPFSRFDGSLDPFLYRTNGFAANPQYRDQADGPDAGSSVADGAMVARDGRVIFWRMGAEGHFYFMDDQFRTNIEVSSMAGDGGKRIYAAYVQCAVDAAPRTSILTYGEIMGGDDWKPGERPQLAADAAVRSAWVRLQGATGDKDAGAWRLSRVAVTRYGMNMTRKWYYIVYFVKQTAPATEIPVLVAMNGVSGGIYQADAAPARLAESQTQYNADLQRIYQQRWRGFAGGGLMLPRD